MAKMAEVKAAKQVIFLADPGTDKRLSALADYKRQSRSWVVRMLVDLAYSALLEREAAGLVRLVDLVTAEEIEAYIVHGEAP